MRLILDGDAVLLVLFKLRALFLFPCSIVVFLSIYALMEGGCVGLSGREGLLFGSGGVVVECEGMSCHWMDLQ